MESLRQKQSRFVRLLMKLIAHIHAAGYEVTLGEAKRTAEQAAWNALPPPSKKQVAKAVAEAGYPGYADKLFDSTSKGSHRSAHIHSLAIDLNLFRNGVYLAKTEDHAPFGAYWETLAPDCRWGGRFQDGNHYSIEHGGVM